MAAYPIATASPGSVESPSQKADAFVDGAGGTHVYWPAQKKRFSLKHKLTLAERDTLLAFFETNKLLTITFLWTNNGGASFTSYNVCFVERPYDEAIPDFPAYRQVSVELAEV